MLIERLRGQALRPLYDESTTGGSAPAAETPPPSAPDANGPSTPAPDTVDSLPDWAQKLIRDTRQEAASHRARLKAQEDAQTDAARKAAEEAGNFKALYEQTQAKLQEREAADAKAAELAARQEAAKAAGLDEAMAARLQGATAEEWLADAKALAKHLKPAAPSTGATNPAASRGGASLSVEEQVERDWKQRKRASGFRIA